jgi:RNA-binding protein MEX3
MPASLNNSSIQTKSAILLQDDSQQQLISCKTQASNMNLSNEDLRRISQNITESVPVPSSEHVAEIVGRQGCKIKALRAKTNTYIKTPIRGEMPMFVITGRKEDVLIAKREIQLAADHFSQIRARRGSSSSSSNGSNGTNTISSSVLTGCSTLTAPPSACFSSSANHLNSNSISNTLTSEISTPIESDDLLCSQSTLTRNLNIAQPGQIVKKVTVPYQVVGLVVGPKGSTIKRIQQNTQTYIVTPSRDSQPVFEIQGMPENVEAAKAEIENYILLRTTSSGHYSSSSSSSSSASSSHDPIQITAGLISSISDEFNDLKLDGHNSNNCTTQNSSLISPPSIFQTDEFIANNIWSPYKTVGMLNDDSSLLVNSFQQMNLLINNGSNNMVSNTISNNLNGTETNRSSASSCSSSSSTSSSFTSNEATNQILNNQNAVYLFDEFSSNSLGGDCLSNGGDLVDLTNTSLTNSTATHLFPYTSASDEIVSILQQHHHTANFLPNSYFSYGSEQI